MNMMEEADMKKEAMSKTEVPFTVNGCKAMTKEDIFKHLTELVDGGKMLSRPMLSQGGGLNYYAITKKCERGELHRSRIGKVYFTESVDKDWFDSLVFCDLDNKRIYTSADMESIFGETKYYGWLKKCASGEMLQFDGVGKSATLYIK